MSQADFARALLDPAAAVPCGLVDASGGPAGRRFDVYRNNVTVSLIEALGQGFPVIRKLVGDAFFGAMARTFVRAHPPTSPCLMFYGGDFPEFLATFPPVAELPYLPDMARLELALRRSYHAADAVPIAHGLLGALDPTALAEARFSLAPAVAVLSSSWPIGSIWAANTQDAPPPTHMEAEDILIVRPAFDPEPHLLPSGGATFVRALLNGRPVGEAAGIGATDFAAVFALLLQGGAITAIEPPLTSQGESRSNPFG